MFGDRRKTGGLNLNGPRASLAITPTKRFTDLGVNSMRKSTARVSLSQTSGQPRMSLFQSKSTAPRDVKALVSSNVTKIYNFLVEHEATEAPSEKDIRSPRGKNDFVVFFELIYGHLSKDYEFPQDTRLEDEIPLIFKGLGYPYPLKNSYFQPMGSSHGYPHLLDALSWLIDLAKISSSVRSDTKNIIFGDFMDQNKALEKILSYSWLSTVYKDFTNDRKAAETDQFWVETKETLRKHFEHNNEYDDMIETAKSALEQLRFECDEIESEKGNEQSLQEEIARIRDDIRKASDYLEQTEMLKERTQEELNEIKTQLDTKSVESEKMQGMVNELKARIEQQKLHQGLTGKEVRQMNLENNKDKETVAELQAQLEELSKQAWKLKNDESFKEQKTKFVHLVENALKVLSGIGINTNSDAFKVPANEKELQASWEAINNVWLPEINRQLHQRKLELETEKLQFADKFASAEERIQMETEMLREAKKKEMREDRLRRTEREEWKESRQQLEKRLDELENEKEVLKKQLQIDGSLEKEIETERVRMAKIEKEMEAQKQRLEAAIRKKMDEIVEETSGIENSKMMFHKSCVEVEKTVKALKVSNNQ